MIDTIENPFSGKGKPEPLKGDLSGFWSKRINDKHRMIYKVEEGILYIISFYGHYDDK
ncbi:MAG: Txe/YoeB family addiction module toxin [Bacteroidota bacterium]